jgi:hypothetical protein
MEDEWKCRKPRRELFFCTFSNAIRSDIVTYFVRAILVIGLLTLSLAAVSAQDQPVATEEAQAPQVIQPTQELLQPTVPLPTAIAPAATQEAVPVEPTAVPAPTINEGTSILINARSDLELLANERLGTQRPEGWSGSIDINDPQLVILVRLDLELLTGQLVGQNVRPPGWFGAVPSTPFAIARDIRHDLELLADVTGLPNVRPPGWAGDDPIYRCDRATQTLVSLLERGGVFQLAIDPLATDYCQQAAVEASRFAEANLLSNPAPGAAPGSAAAPQAGSVTVDNSFTAAFLDLNARQRVGLIPTGETFTPVARSANPFSNMMLVRGNGFEVYVDYATTAVSTEEFQALPTVETVPPNTACTALWCS